MAELTCLKTYDIRGKVGVNINEEIVYRIARAVGENFNAKSVVIGFDARETSPLFAAEAAKGIIHTGADVLDIGMAGTEEMYWAVTEFGACAGIEITASHNPIEYNGMKIVGCSSKPLSNNDFLKIKQLAEENSFFQPQNKGAVLDRKEIARAAYIRKILSFVDCALLKPLKIVINSGNGAAGPTLDAINKKLDERGVETNFIFVNHEPDPTFPKGIPNPLLKENRSSTADIVVNQKADFGIAFDGDFDRCFFFDHCGDFISGEYLVGLIAEVFLIKEKGATIIHDPRVMWNTIDVIGEYGGQAVVSKTGHAFVKSAMRNFDAIYGGEMSAHHYFRDFSYCDSGVIPWLLIWELLSTSNLSLSDLIAERKKRFPSCGELNFTILDAEKCLEKIRNHFATSAKSISELDGLSMSFDDWRFNIRKSNTEPLVRLNVEARDDHVLLKEKTEKLKNMIN